MAKMKKKLGFLLLIVALLLIFYQAFQITGNAILENKTNFSITGIFGIILLIISLFLLTSKKSLDAIVIPTGPSYEEDIERTERAIKEYKKSGAKYFVISGQKNKGMSLKDTQRAKIYLKLRESGIKPKQMKIEGKSSNTMENLVYTLDLLRKEDKKDYPLDVGFVSYPGHLDRIEDFYDRAVKNGLVNPKEVRFHRVETKESAEEKKYESSLLRKILHKLKLSRMPKKTDSSSKPL